MDAKQKKEKQVNKSIESENKSAEKTEAKKSVCYPEDRNSKSYIRKEIIFCGILLIVIAAVVLAVLKISDSKKTVSDTLSDAVVQVTIAPDGNYDGYNPSTPLTKAPEQTPIFTETPTPTEEPTPFDRDSLDWLYDGTYSVGKDIDAGVYYMEANKNTYGYFAILENPLDDVNGIVTSGEFSTFTFVKVKKGEFLEVMGASLTRAKNIPPIQPDENGVYGEGMYRIGVDIMQGAYRLECVSDKGAYYEVATNSRHSVQSKLINDNFIGEKLIFINDGSYLTIKRANFFKIEQITNSDTVDSDYDDFDYSDSDYVDFDDVGNND